MKGKNHVRVRSNIKKPLLFDDVFKCLVQNEKKKLLNSINCFRASVVTENVYKQNILMLVLSGNLLFTTHFSHNVKMLFKTSFH